MLRCTIVTKFINEISRRTQMGAYLPGAAPMLVKVGLTDANSDADAELISLGG